MEYRLSKESNVPKSITFSKKQHVKMCSMRCFVLRERSCIIGGGGVGRNYGTVPKCYLFPYMLLFFTNNAP